VFTGGKNLLENTEGAIKHGQSRVHTTQNEDKQNKTTTRHATTTIRKKIQIT